MSYSYKTIGVLGGMGPAATASFMQRVIDLTMAEDDANHVPLLVDMNPQIPSRISAILDGGEDPAPALAEMAKSLERSGAAALAMPCNTAHYYAEAITQAVDIPLLNMLTLAATDVRRAIGGAGTGKAKVGLLASPLTDQVHIFRDAFAPQDLDVIFPHDADHVLSIIREIKANGLSDDMASALLALGQELESRGASCLLVGCSEFSMLTRELETELPVRDTVDILAAEVIRFSGAVLKGT